MARGFMAAHRSFFYEYEVLLPGEPEMHSIDFMLDNETIPIPVEVKGMIGHSKPEDIMHDLLRESELSEELVNFGIANDFKSVFDYELRTQEMANEVARRL